jgi:hypothetical protein
MSSPSASIRPQTTALAISPSKTNSTADASSPIPSGDHLSWRGVTRGERLGVNDGEIVKSSVRVNVSVGVGLGFGDPVGIGVGSGKCVADGTNVPDGRSKYVGLIGLDICQCAVAPLVSEGVKLSVRVNTKVRVKIDVGRNFLLGRVRLRLNRRVRAKWAVRGRLSHAVAMVCEWCSAALTK